MQDNQGFPSSCRWGGGPVWRWGLKAAAVYGAVGVVLCLGGCKPKEPAAEVVTLEGKIEKIEAGSAGGGRITVSYFNEKQKKDVTGVGEITKETEIMINGAASTIQDLREGDRVRGQVRVEKVGDKQSQIALKIFVERPK